MPCRPLMLLLKVPEIISQKKISSSFLTLSRLSVFPAELPFSLSLFSAMLSPSLSLPSFASSLQQTKALAVQTAIVGGGAGFSLYFPLAKERESASFLVSLSSHDGIFQRPEGYYYPKEIEAMPLGEERYRAFLSFQKELNAFLFPFFCEAFPLAERLGEQRFLSSCLPYEEKHKSGKAWLLLPASKALVTSEAF